MQFLKYIMLMFHIESKIIKNYWKNQLKLDKLLSLIINIHFMKSIYKLLFIILLSVSSWAQKNDDYVKHTVLKGENVTQIAKKYKVSPYDIYRLNPSAKEGIKEGEVLLINFILQDKKNKKEANKNIKKDLVVSEKYTVKEQETMYGLSKKFNVSQDELKEWNPIIVENGLQAGLELTIKKPNFQGVINQTDGAKIEAVKTPNESKSELVNVLNDSIKYQQYTILPRETLYGVSKKFNVSQMKILELNPILIEGFKEGLVINLPNSKLEEIQQNQNKVALVAKKSNEERTLVIFLPFDIAKMESDTVKSKSDYLKADKTLNIALDFYAGQLLALDSLKKMGYNLKVKIFDTESSVSKINEIIAKNDFSKVDAVIGPLFNNQIEQTALLLKKYNIPVISPLSSKTGKPFENIYYSRPTEQIEREELMKYFNENNGNILAIFSKKKVAVKEELQAQFPDLKTVPLTEKGDVTEVGIEALLMKEKKNFVILETESIGMTLNATGILSKLKLKYDIQLVVLKLYDVLDFEAIKIKSLTNLDLMYPSNNRNNNSGYYKSFAKKFKNTNNINPNAFATRGFDVTLDTVLRMYQDGGFIASTTEYASEQLESKFNYIKIENGNYNNAIYLHQFMEDLTIKQIK
jgi:LysM repeat protein